jgi:hypothetical protein
MIGITTFGDNRLRRSLERFESQASSIEVFDQVSINSEQDLPEWYKKDHAERLVRGSRGFGYWCWKPFVILQSLQNMPELDVLFWCDVGCHIRAEGRNRLMDYVDSLNGSNFDFLAFQGTIAGAYFEHDGRRLPDVTEAHWTKGDLFSEFGIRPDHEHALSAQFGTGVFAVKNNSAVRDMLETWIQKTKQSPFLFNDEASTKDNFKGFREHRHDQSYFSLCAKGMGAVRFSAFEYWYPEPVAEGFDVFQATPDWETLSLSPFWALRDKSIPRWQLQVDRAHRFFQKIKI